MRPYNTIILAIVIITMFRAQQKAHVDVGNSEYVEVTVASAERTLHALIIALGRVLSMYAHALSGMYASGGSFLATAQSLLFLALVDSIAACTVSFSYKDLCLMPLELGADGIHRVCSSRGGTQTERVSNFTLKFTAMVNEGKSTMKGGPGFLVSVKRYPDGIEK